MSVVVDGVFNRLLPVFHSKETTRRWAATKVKLVAVQAAVDRLLEDRRQRLGDDVGKYMRDFIYTEATQLQTGLVTLANAMGSAYGVQQKMAYANYVSRARQLRDMLKDLHNLGTPVSFQQQKEYKQQSAPFHDAMRGLYNAH